MTLDWGLIAYLTVVFGLAALAMFVEWFALK
jgi:hypothetical protein